jgi:MFS family permease
MQAVFLVPMTDELGWSRADYTWAQTIGTFVMSGAGFVVGSMLDARGPRRFMLAGAVALSGCVVLLSQVHELWQFLLLRGIGMTLGALLVGNLIVNSTVSKWFVRKRAMAIAFATMGMSLSGVITPRIGAALIGEFDWRTAWVIIGLASLCLTLPAALVMRRRPEDHGLLPDGDAEDYEPPPSRRPQVTAANEVQWTRAEAVRTRSFWLLVLCFGLASFGSGSFFLHLISFLRDSGYSAGEAASLFGTMLLATALSRPLWGNLMQRIAPRHSAVLSFFLNAVSALGIVLSLDADNSTMLYVSLVCWGIGFGGVVPMQELIWATYFGRAHIGRVRSVAMPMLGLASALGPQFAARVYDAAGSYSFAFVVFAGMSLLAGVCAFIARPPSKEPVTATPIPAPLSA